ncbi:MAG: DUF1361 domain-containing protein, partial [Candidatus Levybacteria bacterium]|nr:DUF1361 domain-containing protein [Candidatus Levybacteria bacterium]
VAILFGWLMSKADSSFAKLWTGFLWLIFLPNTIYILTDVSHLFEDLPKVGNLFKLILILQYSLFSIFGVITFTISTYFFQRLLEKKSADRRKNRIKTTTIISIFILNFIVGFGVVLGGIRRTNSWYIFTNPSRVLEDTLSVIYSQDLLMLSLGIGLLANLIYFTTAETVATWGKKYLKK